MQFLKNNLTFLHIIVCIPTRALNQGRVDDVRLNLCGGW